jgi:2-phospho-L-lactate guanylyltransferase (CobY/MobA/RfbA family)
LFFSLPNPFHFHFGTKSFQAHLSKAREAGINPIIFYSIETALDIDDSEALKKLREIISQEIQVKKSKTCQVLHEFQKRKKEVA